MGDLADDYFWGEENVLKFTVVMVACICEYIKKQWIDLYAYHIELYLNEAILRCRLSIDIEDIKKKQI